MIGYPAGSEQVHAAQRSLRLPGLQPLRRHFFAGEQPAALRLVFFGGFDAYAPPRTRGGRSLARGFPVALLFHPSNGV